MQAASVDLQSVLRWLTGTRGIAIHEEWFRACVEWILSEEEVDSEEHLRELVYEQWLHADLRDVVPHGCIPDCVAQQHKGKIRGRFIVQVQSVVDVSRPAYGQLQKLKGKSLDEGEPAEKKYSEPKANRLLLLELTDGVTNIQAMEYQPIKQLNVQQLLPGAKLVIEGDIQCRLGVLLLNEGQVQILGGQVEQLVEANAPRKVLARLLNDESLAGNDEPRGKEVSSGPDRDNTAAPAITGGTSSHVLSQSSTTSTVVPSRTHNIHDRSGASRPSATATSSTRQQHGDTHNRSSAVSASSTSSRQQEGIAHRLSSTAVIGDNRHTKVGDELYKNSTEVGGGGDVSELVGGEVDLDNFEDFDDNLYDEMEIEGGGGEVTDIPGHHEWPQDNHSQNDFQLQEQDAVKESFSNKKKNTRSSKTIGGAGNLEISPSHSLSRMESSAPRSKLSLRQQKSSKTRVCELEQGGRGERRESQRVKNPPVASVKPIQQQQQELPQNREKQHVVATSSRMLMESELYEEPIVLKSIPEVENNSWKLQPFVKIKAHFVRVCEMLDHTSGVWKVTVMIGDDQGCKLRVHLSDKILEALIGFSAQEFKDHINPHKDIPKVKARAAKGFSHCSSALEDLNCFMVMTRRTDLAYPCVIQLLDH